MAAGWKHGRAGPVRYGSGVAAVAWCFHGLKSKTKIHTFAWTLKSSKLSFFLPSVVVTGCLFPFVSLACCTGGINSTSKYILAVP